jgi:hypothetical protein
MRKGYFNLRTVMAMGAMVALAACGGTGSNVPANSSVDTGTPAGAVTGAEDAAGAGTTGTEGTTGALPAATPAPTDGSIESGAATSGDTGTGSTGTTTGTATPDAGTTGATAGGDTGGTTTSATAGTPLTGPNISFGGISFDVDQGVVPSVTVMTGPVNMMGMGTGTGATGDTGTDMAGSGNLSGTVFTFEGMNMGMGGTGTTDDAGAGTTGTAAMFQPRIVVIPVAQLVSYEASMMAAGQAGTGTDAAGAGTTGTDASSSGTTTGTNAAGTATPAAGTTGDTTTGATGTTGDQGITDNLFISELSRTLASQSAFPSTSMANSMVLTRALSLMGFQGYTPAFQSNGEFLDFQNGRGVRFVTAFQPQGSNMAALNQLYYMFHGLTNDNQNYVMALMPLQSNVIGTGMGTGTGTTAATPAAGASTTTTGTTGTDAGTTGAGTTGAIEFPQGGDAAAYQSYLDEVVAGLDQASDGTTDAAFSTQLEQYDSLVQSLNIAEGTQ